MPSFFSNVATTLQLQAPFTALMALVAYRLWRLYGSQPLRDLAIGWSLWTARIVVVSYAAALRAMGEAPHAPMRRVLTAVGVALVLAAIPYLVRSTLSLARGQEEIASPHRLSIGLMVVAFPLSIIASADGMPAWWRLAVLVLSSTVSFSVAFGYVSWRLWRQPADELTTARQLAAVGFGAYAAKQLWNAQAFLSAGPPDASASAIVENIVLIMVAMGSIALLFDRQRQRELHAEREQRRLEAELAASQHLETLGRLAGGVAHDFNNLLTSIKCGVQLARDVTDDRDMLLEELELIESTTNRASALTRRLLTFARRERVQPVAFELVQRIHDLHRYLEKQLSGTAILKLQLPDTPVIVMADPSQIDQAVINLVLNARDALDGAGGRIRLSLALAPGALRDDDAVRLSVEDNGVGMDEATQARIFEPFFSTKGVERGTGLGLAIVHTAVSQARGEILVESTPGVGTRFDILLPIERNVQPADPTPPRGHVVVQAERARVLVVDDDEMARRASVRLLTRRGFQVTETADAESALALHAMGAGGGTPFDLILTDIVMPGMNGRALARSLRLRDPQLAIVYMSGYDADTRESEPDAPDAPFVAKPFSEATLLQSIQEALGTAAI